MQIFVKTRSMVSQGNWRPNTCFAVSKVYAEMKVFPRQDSHGNQLQHLSYSLLLLSHKADRDWEVCMTHFLPLSSFLNIALWNILIIIFNVTQKTALRLSSPLDLINNLFFILHFQCVCVCVFYAACGANFNQCFSTRSNTIHRTQFMPQDQRNKLRFIILYDSSFLTKCIKRRMFN